MKCLSRIFQITEHNHYRQLQSECNFISPKDISSCQMHREWEMFSHARYKIQQTAAGVSTQNLSVNGGREDGGAFHEYSLLLLNANNAPLITPSAILGRAIQPRFYYYHDKRKKYGWVTDK